MNYFELFELPFQFELDSAKLTETYRQLQRSVHPDRFAHADEHQQLLAVQKSAQVNDAFETLKHPLSRAVYMLGEKGIDLQIEQKTLQDPAFLMQQMEYREQIEDISEQDDPLDAIEDFEDEVDRQTKAFFADLAPLLTADCKIKLEEAAVLIRKLKFMYKLREELHRLEESLH